MAISRAQMRTQLKGGTMKKATKKKGGGKVRGVGCCMKGKTKGTMR